MEEEPYDWTDDPDLSADEIRARFYALPRTPIEPQVSEGWLIVQHSPWTTGSGRSQVIDKETQLREPTDWRELVA